MGKKFSNCDLQRDIIDSMISITMLSSESIVVARKFSNFSLSSIQLKLKFDLGGYLSEPHLIICHSDSSLELFRCHSQITSDIFSDDNFIFFRLLAFTALFSDNNLFIQFPSSNQFSANILIRLYTIIPNSLDAFEFHTYVFDSGVLRLFNDMHFPLSRAANIVANFVGIVFLSSLLRGFLSGSYLGSFWIMLFFEFVELSGFILLSVQAHLPQLRPSQCNMLSTWEQCMEATSIKAIICFIALYLVALGQFGFITRARIILQEAPKKVKWVRAFYDDFLTFTKDQEPLILMPEKVDYVIGFMVLIGCHELSPNKGVTIWCFQPRGRGWVRRGMG